MRFRLTLLVAPCFFLALLPPLAAQPGDKKKDGDPKKEADKEITADTKIGGKKLDEWIKLISDRDRSQTEIAIKTILSYGPTLAKKAVPDLIKELQKHNKPLPIDLSVRVNGCIALGMILGGLDKPDETEQKQIEEAVEVLRSMLKDGQVIVKYRAAQALTQMGPMARAAVPELEALVGDTNTWETRHAAAVALGTVALDRKELRKSTVAILHTRLGYTYNPKAKKWLSDEASVKVRLAVLAALDNLGVVKLGDAKQKELFQKALDTMVKYDPDPLVKLRATVMVFPVLKTPADKKERAAAIAAYFKDADAQVRAEVAQLTLAHVDGEYRIELLERMAAQDTDPSLRLRAHLMIYAVLKTALDKDRRVAQIAAFFRSNDPLLRIEAAHEVMAHLELEHKLRLIEEMAGTDADPVLRVRAHMMIYSLLKSDKEKHERAALVAQFLKYPDVGARVEAAQVLGQMGEDAAGQVPQLIAALKDREPTVVGWSIAALVHMGKAAAPAVPLLEMIVKDANVPEEVRETAREAIKTIKANLQPKGGGK
jgi:HEAT repeat protein